MCLTGSLLVVRWQSSMQPTQQGLRGKKSKYDRVHKTVYQAKKGVTLFQSGE